MKTSEMYQKIYEAFVLAQGEFEGAVKGSENPHFKSKFANMEEVVDGIKQAFKKHSLAFIQSVTGEGPATILSTRIIHKSGEWIETYYPLTCKDWTNPQSVGSAMTYAKRYGLQAATGLPSIDDDGHAATDRPQPYQQQLIPNKAPVPGPAKQTFIPPKEVQERLKPNVPATKTFAQKYSKPAATNQTPPGFDANEPWPDQP
jgi:ERF superfamily protein